MFLIKDYILNVSTWAVLPLVNMGPFTLTFNRVAQPFLKFDRRHWAILKLRGKF